MNLAQTDNAKRFIAMLEKTEKARTYELTEWEQKFCSDLRARFDSREDAKDLGQNPWNPSMNQWNTLHTIAGKL